MKHNRLAGFTATVLFTAVAIGCTGTSGSSPGTGGSGATGGTGGGGGTSSPPGMGGAAAGGSGGTGNSAGAGATGGSAGTGAAGTSGRGGSGVAGAGGTGGSTGGRGGTGGATGGSAGGGTGGAAGGTGGARGGSGGGGRGGATGAGGTGGTAGATGAGTCLDGMQNGTETGVDCGGSCPACPNYKLGNGPNTGDTVGSGCNGNGPAFMCARDLLYSPEFKVAEADDFGSPTNPQFVYGVVGHDKDSGGLDTEAGSNACCQCYQLVFTTPRDNVSGLATPKPMIVQAFNTGAGGGKNFDIYMGSGGLGANSAGCMRQYTAYPNIGQPNNGGIRSLNVSQCAGSMNMYSATSIATMSCQSALAADCAMITASNASVQDATQDSCVESNQPQNLYHLNWNVMAKRIECPANLTRVTGCKLNSQNLPAADPTAIDMNSASSKGFSSGYTTTTMQDCCRPTCAYKGNVTGADATYKQYYTCDSSGSPM